MTSSFSEPGFFCFIDSVVLDYASVLIEAVWLGWYCTGRLGTMRSGVIVLKVQLIECFLLMMSLWYEIE